VIDVGPLEEFEPGRIRVVKAGRTEIGVVRWQDGALYALRNVCPHRGAPLCRGVVTAMIDATEPGALRADATRPVIACAWHAWEFDVRTGRAVLESSNYTVRTYPVEVRDGRVLVDVRRRDAVASTRHDDRR
jgi:nitrite reductase/ring-hydroxylating ferredoxin subunit